MNITTFRLSGAIPQTAGHLAELLDHPFTAPGPTERMSAGWVSPQTGGPLVEPIAGCWHIRARMETRMLPAHVVARAAQVRAASIEAETGRKPNRKAMKAIKEEVTLDLLPKPKRVHRDNSALVREIAAAEVVSDVELPPSNAARGQAARAVLEKVSAMKPGDCITISTAAAKLFAQHEKKLVTVRRLTETTSGVWLKSPEDKAR